METFVLTANGLSSVTTLASLKNVLTLKRLSVKLG
jgi:hypothetical protein